jgi:hypothetical protein
VSSNYYVSPDNGDSSAATIIIQFSQADLEYLGEGHSAQTLIMYSRSLDDETWVELPTTVDTISNTAATVGETNRFFALFSAPDLTDVGDEPSDQLPYDFELSQNYPNPFNPVTTIVYDLPQRSRVTIEIYNVLDQKVRTLVDREQPAGSYTISWDGTSSSGDAVATGVYLYRFQADEYVETKKMLLLK